MGHETLLRREDTVLVVVDVQEKLLPAMSGGEGVLAACVRLVQAARLLDVPVIVTEQYPKGLGSTVPALKDVLGDSPVFEKLSFSCAGADAFLDHMEDLDRDQVILCGIETHVCVLQTALDLLDQGAQVHVAADATSSRSPENRAVALDRMRREGVVVTAAESAMFEWLRAAGTEEFKAISRLVR